MLPSKPCSVGRVFKSAKRQSMLLAAAWSVISCHAVELPSGWRHVQSFSVESAGLVKFSLPMATLDAARPGLEDLRIYDDTGAEIPLLIEKPAPAALDRTQ